MHGIERWAGGARGRSRASAWRDLVFTVATGEGATVAEQTRAALAGSDRVEITVIAARDT